MTFKQIQRSSYFGIVLLLALAHSASATNYCTPTFFNALVAIPLQVFTEENNSPGTNTWSIETPDRSFYGSPLPLNSDVLAQSIPYLNSASPACAGSIVSGSGTGSPTLYTPFTTAYNSLTLAERSSCLTEMNAAMGGTQYLRAYYVKTQNTCTPGFTYVASGTYCELTSPNAASSTLLECANGESSQQGSSLPASHKTDGANTCCAADPVTISTGNVYEEELDYRSSSSGSLAYTRYYNSDPTVTPGRLGPGWRDSFDRMIVKSSDLPASASTYNGIAVALVYRPDGKIIVFKISQTPYTPVDSDTVENLAAVTMPDGTTGWSFTDADSNVEYYEVVTGQNLAGPAHYGQLASIVYRGGMRLLLTYGSGGTGNNSFLTAASDAFGHTLTFSADSTGTRVSTMTDLAGNIYSYTYNSQGYLGSVTRPASPAAPRQYQYTQESTTSTTLPAPVLSAILDESGNTLSTWTYDYLGRAVSNSMGGALGAAPYAFSYTTTAASAPRQATTTGTGSVVTYGSAGTDTYTFSTVNGVPTPTKVVSNTGSGSMTRSYVVDANGRTTSETNGNGVVTTHTYSTDGRGLETSRTEASGTTSVRTTTTQWSPSFRLPISISVYANSSGTGTAISTEARTYDTAGRLVTRVITDPSSGASRTWTYTYDSYGRVLTVKGPRTDVNDTSTFTYYTCTTGIQCGQLETMTDSLGHITSFTIYNNNGLPTAIIDPNGNVTVLAYDSNNRLLSATTGAETTSFAYYSTGRLQQTTLPDGAYLLYSYDAAQRLTQISDSAGNKTIFTLDSMGNRLVDNSYDPTGVLDFTITRTFDAINRLATTVGSANTPAVTTSYSYDAASNIAQVVAPLSRTTTNTYDSLNRLTKIVNPAAGNTLFQYDALSDVTRATDPNGFVTTHQYNGFNQPVQLVSPDTGTTAYSYDSAGNLAQAVNARGVTSSFTYDAANRLTSSGFTSGSGSDPIISLAYDSALNGVGRLTGASDSNHSMTWSYDALGRVSIKSQTVSGVALNVTYQHSSGDLQQITTPSGQVIAFSYSNHAISAIAVNGTTLVSSVSYEPFGPARGWTWGNGTAEVRLYNADGNPSQFGGPELFSYGYDNALRMTSLTDSANSAQSWTAGYDSLDRLASAASSGATYGWTYDANGNRLTQTGTNASTYSVSSADNQITSVTGALSRTYAYDSGGNVLSDTAAMFTYNKRGRMVSATASGTTTSYIFNALGERIKKSGGPAGTVFFMYDEQGHMLGEYSTTGSLIQETVWMRDTPVATIQPNGAGGIAVFYIHSDQLNAPRIITNSSNAVLWRRDHDPFGTAAPNGNPLGLGTFTYNLRFPGQYADQETGLNYNYFRDYDPNTGKYLESDPIGLRGGTNTYAYVSGNPISNFDPSGLAQFGYRPLGRLPWLGDSSRNPLDDYFHTDVSHEQLFFEDALSPSNLGFFNDEWGGGLQSGEDQSQFHMDPEHFDDQVMRQAVKNVDPGRYKLFGNNCQTYADNLRAEYRRLLKTPLWVSHK